MARIARRPFPTDEITLSGRPVTHLVAIDSGALADEKTRVMSQAMARRVLAREADTTVLQPRPGAEVAAAIAAVQGPSPTIGAPTSPPPPPLMRMTGAGAAAARGSTAVPRNARTPTPEPGARPDPAGTPAGQRSPTSARSEK